MIPVTILENGNQMSVFGLGTWELTGNNCINAVKTALKLGYNHIDTAEIYGNQKEIGKAINGIPRDKLFITSKVWRDNLNYKDVMTACDNTLNDLGVEYLDQYLIHYPNRNISIKETFDALSKLYKEGIIKSVGVSNFTIRHLQDAIKIAQVPICVNQVEFHPLLYQKDLLNFCEKYNIKITAYSPLARTEVFDITLLKKLGKQYKKTAGQISLKWLLQKGVIVIPKASSEAHLKENLDIFDFELSEADSELIDNLRISKRLVIPPFAEFDYI